MGVEKEIILFTLDDWKRENDRIVDEAKTAGVNYDPSVRADAHRKYAQEMFKQFPDDESIEVQVAYLLKNMVCAQFFEFGNKRTARNMAVEFSKVNGYDLLATTKEWVRVCKKLQRKVPKQFVIHKPHMKVSNLFREYIKGTGGGYAVDIKNIPMGAKGSSWYNKWIIDWVKEHLERKN